MIKAALFTFLFVLLVVGSKAQNAMVSWKKINEIAFIDAAEKTTHISGSAPTVFVMLSPECPLCRNYVPVLNELKKQYPGVSFYGIFPGKSYGSKEIIQFQKEYRITFKTLMDPQKKLSTYLKATTTPECIFVNKMGGVVYRGLIDNWPSGLGQKRTVVTEKYLAAALNQAKSGESIAIKQTKPIGCLINDL